MTTPSETKTPLSQEHPCPVWRAANTDSVESLSQSLSSAADLLRNNQVVGFPTETVYGLGANALSDEAIEKIFQAKGRPSDNPLIVHVCDREMLNGLTPNLTPQAAKLIEHFWPGPLTVVVQASSKISKKCTAGLDTVGIRMPDHKVARELIRLSGVPIAAPSANISGRPSPTTAAHVLTDLGARIKGVLDGGSTGIGLESTVVDCTSPDADEVVILRPGGITREMLATVIPRVEIDPALSKLHGYGAHATPKNNKPTTPSASASDSASLLEDGAASAGPDELKPRAPGMKYRHYAPAAPVHIVKGSDSFFANIIRAAQSEGKKVGLLATKEKVGALQSLDVKADLVAVCGEEDSLDSVARDLYSALRLFDEADIVRVDVIYAQGFDQSGIGMAVMNRLEKAAAGRFLRETNSE